MSLRTRFLLLVLPSLLLPLLAYLLVDTVLYQRLLVRDQAEQLRLHAQLIALSGVADSPTGPQELQVICDGLLELRPDVEILLVDQESRVLAATMPGLVGRVWKEATIDEVLSQQKRFVWATGEHHGEEVLDVTIPWSTSRGEPRGAVHLARSLSAVEAEVSRARRRHAAFVALALFVSGLMLTVFVYRFVLRRLSRTERAMFELVGAKGRQIEVGPGDEIDHLDRVLRSLVEDLASTAEQLRLALVEKSELLARVEGFNQELEVEVQGARAQLIRAQKELLRAEHFSTIGQLSAGLAHELRNPLFIIRATMQSHARKHAEAKAVAADIIEEVDRVNGLIGRLLDLGRPVQTQSQSVDVEALLRRAGAKALRGGGQEAGVQLHFEGHWEGALPGDEAFLLQGFLNLITNACQSGPVPGRDSVVDIRWEGAGTEGWVEVRDRGRGIEPEDLPRLFEPFFTRRARGIGLGLSVAKKVFEAHGAEILLDSQPGSGTTVKVVFSGERRTAS